MKTRIHFLDNLRTFMILLVVILHSGMVYMAGFEKFWPVDDPDKINSIGLINMYIDIFVMFTIFFISGYLIPLSLNSKTTNGFLLSKVKRIIFPWLLAVFTLIPAQKAIFLYSRGLPQEEWYSYFHLFTRSGSDLWFYSNNPTQSWLWFLPVLFIFQVAYLALAKLKLLNIKISFKTGVMITFIAGISYSMLISSMDLYGWYHSWVLDFQRERLLVYFMVFLLGSLAYKHKVFDTSVKNKKMYITANIVLTIALGLFTAVALNLFFNIINPERNYYFVSPFVDKTAYYATSMLSMMSFLYILLYVFRFRLNKTSRVIDRFNQSSYQVYIIHMVIMGVVALLLINTGLPVIAKYILLVTLTYFISNGLVMLYNMIMRDNMVLKTAAATISLAILLISIPHLKSEEIQKKDGHQQIAQAINIPKMGLHEAVVANDLETVKQHIGLGSDLNIQEPSGGSSPLITAALFGRTEIAVALIDAGANINFQNNDGSTPLHTAAFFCRTDIVKTLLDVGADKSIINNSGSTALESVTVPFEFVEGIYDYFANTLGPLGLALDKDELKKTRPVIADLLQQD